MIPKQFFPENLESVIAARERRLERQSARDKAREVLEKASVEVGVQALARNPERMRKVKAARLEAEEAFESARRAFLAAAQEEEEIKAAAREALRGIWQERHAELIRKLAEILEQAKVANDELHELELSARHVFGSLNSPIDARSFTYCDEIPAWLKYNQRIIERAVKRAHWG